MQVEQLVGDCLLGGGLVAYMGSLTSEARADLFFRWKTAFEELPEGKKVI